MIVRLPLNCLVVALTIWSRASFRSAVGVRRSLGLGGLIPHFFHVHERGRSVVIEDYIPRRRKTAMLDPGDTFIAFDGIYRVRVFVEVGSATSDTLFGAYRAALLAAAASMPPGSRGGAGPVRTAKSRLNGRRGRHKGTGMGRASTGISYGGGIVSIMAALTLTDWGIVLGMITAVATFGVNWYYKHRDDTRAREEHEAYLASLTMDRRKRDEDVPYRRRQGDAPSASRGKRRAR
ncbi:MAG: hypothetical protein BWY25_03097 [Chloroflexi bacterium ADurb.Bin222]|nr:MAG: hypothetical protein BWY25_03097 [Chloroflexi bacterium ADurb.Bin222]